MSSVGRLVGQVPFGDSTTTERKKRSKARHALIACPVKSTVGDTVGYAGTGARPSADSLAMRRQVATGPTPLTSLVS
jgi:hypothetical protein